MAIERDGGTRVLGPSCPGTEEENEGQDASDHEGFVEVGRGHAAMIAGAVKHPPLPVVIPCRHRSPHVAGALHSVQEAGCGPIRLVSEGAYETPPPGTQRVPCDAELGFAGRANRGLRDLWEEGHKRALLLNDDTEVDAGCLPALQEALDDAGVAAAGATLIDWEDGSLQQAGLGFEPRWARLQARREPVQDRVEDRSALSGAALALDLEAWAAVGGFSEAFTFYFEDVDLCLRLRKAGYRVVVVRDARVRHREGGTRGRGTPEAAWHLGRNHMLLARRLGGPPAERSLRLASTATLAFAWSLRAQGVGGLAPVARGLWAGLQASTADPV